MKWLRPYRGQLSHAVLTRTIQPNREDYIEFHCGVARNASEVREGTDRHCKQCEDYIRNSPDFIRIMDRKF